MSEVNEKTPLWRCRNLRKLFAGKSSFFQKDKSWIKAVDDVSFTLNPKETLGVVGESGCGKSTMGRSVLRLIEPTSGEIFYKGKDFTKASGQELRKMRADMQIIFPGSVRILKSENDHRRDHCRAVKYSETL